MIHLVAKARNPGSTAVRNRHIVDIVNSSSRQSLSLKDVALLTHAPFPVKIQAHCFALNYKLDWEDDSRGVHLVEVYCPQMVPRHLLVRVQKLGSSRFFRSRVVLEDRPIPEPKSSSVSSWCGFCADLWASQGKSNCLSARPVAVDASNL